MRISFGLAVPALLAAAHAQAQTATPDVQLPQLQVEGQAERADGPVQGYRAERSSTATRTDTALRDTPQAVVVVPRQVLEDQAVVRLDDALRNVSAVRPGGSGGNRTESYLIRGFRTQNYAIDGTLQNPAAEFVNGFRDLSNIERVEVLKGPASVLYGIGDPGGLINLVTRRPQFTPSGSLTLTGGQFGFVRNEFDITGGLPETGFAARLSGSLTRDEGYREIARRTERVFIAPSIMWQPSDRTRVTVSLTHYDQTGPFDRGLVAQGRQVVVRRDNYYGERWSNGRSIATDFNVRTEHEATDWLTLRQSTRFDWGSAHRYSADPLALSADNRTLTRRATDQDDNSQSVDLLFDGTARFQTGPLRHSTTFGIEYMHAKRSLALYQGTLASIDLLNPVYGAMPGRLALRTVRNDVLDMTSGFLQHQINWNDRLILLAGFRYDNFHQRTVSNNVRTSASDDNIAPRASALYRAWDNVAFFAGWSQSFVPQLGAGANNVGFKPETGEQYEAGIRVDLRPGLTATLAAFSIRRQNVLTADPVNTGFSVQTGTQRSRGIELDVAGEILPGWRVFASAAYLDAVVLADTTYASGRQLTGVPRWSASLWNSYEFQNGPLRGLNLGAGLFAVSGRAGDLNNSYRVGGYTRIDLSASYPVHPNARIQLAVRNLGDVRYIEAPVSRTENYAGSPRTVVASLRLSF
ncbi:TonB-dependent siderophore receptor [Rhodovarius crocodyli]|nr:TonB-dependent siderophore receptor [Rhodovarius crocodyli]